MKKEMTAVEQLKKRVKELQQMNKDQMLSECLRLDWELEEAEEKIEILERHLGIRPWPDYSDLPEGAAKVIPLSQQKSRKRGTFLKI